MKKSETTKIHKLIDNARRNERLRDRLESLGLTLKFETRLMKITNTRWHMGRLIDGRLHNRNAHELSGNTFQVKDIAKKHGFKWDRENKVWWVGAKDFDFTAFAHEVARQSA